MDNEKSTTLTGKVVSGKKEGRYYLSKKKYREQFIDTMGIDPYEGTLNIELDEESTKTFQDIRKLQGTVIEGFKNDQKRLGDVNTFPAVISGIECALVIPEKSDYIDVAEVISNEKLRDELELTDGEKVKIHVFFNQKERHRL